ncbi:hypothetical protein MCOR25_006027 [Pyricularia grisea]|uniref:DUF7587 domain-containing protein n=1 Tax=Pyricularia grisea TaxID=148305 RepID=A0A6P8BHG1_PYRGI|nr:uncharacterized protein PgNI_01684 [Pyricularia grisea]KAI6363083.1 hypothetical protein MCOR25_006027 [Pyricularia grisea]TLD16208.1 hypothetical protein PgNI_01684 [Pyricularia grisea]
MKSTISVLIEELGSLQASNTTNIHDPSPEGVPFVPGSAPGLSNGEICLDDVPRFLYRTYSRKSQGRNDDIWVASKDAAERPAAATNRTDILLRSGDKVAADLNRHARWWPRTRARARRTEKCNLVSWTSSLLFALRMIYFRHRSSRDGSKLEDIWLHVVDTSKFPSGTFVRDAYLYARYAEFDAGPGDTLGDLNETHSSSEFYFGEYFSQGALKVQDRGCAVSAKEMEQAGLLKLGLALNQGMGLANWVVLKRQRWLRSSGRDMSTQELDMAVNIALLFDDYELPMAAAFLALRAWPRNQIKIILSRLCSVTVRCRQDVTELLDVSPKIEGSYRHLDDKMPELKQFEKIMSMVALQLPALYAKRLIDFTSQSLSSLEENIAADGSMTSKPTDMSTLPSEDWLPEKITKEELETIFLREVLKLGEGLRNLREKYERDVAQASE